MSQQSFRVREVSAKTMSTKVGHYMIGTSFYNQGEILGTGGYATVHRATEIFTKMEVAAKIIDLTRFSQRDVARIKRECDILRELSHPNIVRIYEFLEFNCKLYIFMELIQGKELFQLVRKKGPISEFFAVKIFHQICSAIKYLHEKGIAHRDIKTENIMVDSSCNANLIDFGLAKKFKTEQGQLLDTFCGSPSYNAPQIVEKRKYDGKAVDIWCLGVTLYVILQAALPFDQNDEVHRCQNISSINWLKPELSSPEAKEVYASIFRPSKERIGIHKLLDSGLFKKYQLQEKSYYKSWNLQQYTHLQFNQEKINRIAEWLNLASNQVRMEILEKKLTASYCLYELLLEKESKNTLSQSLQLKLKPMTQLQPHRKYTRSLHSQKQNHPLTRPATPKKSLKPEDSEKMPLTILKKYIASKEKDKIQAKQIRVMEPASDRQMILKDSIGLRSKHKKANIFSKIVQIQFPKCKLRDDSPESPKRILDYVKGYK